MQLHWQTSLPLSFLHAADAMMHQRRLADPALEVALKPSVEDLVMALADDATPAEPFLAHLLPLSINYASLQQLTEVALIKTVGRAAAAVRLPRLAAALHAVRQAFTAAAPRAIESLAAPAESLQQCWNASGPGLLNRIVELVCPEILVEEAAVVVLHPGLGGGGKASLDYNLARIEGVDGDPIPELPEILRLGWLVSMLNMDLPRYAEGVRHNPLPVVAHLSMLPVTLAAAERVELARGDEATLSLAVRHWLAPAGHPDSYTAMLLQWWDVYKTMRPNWATALQALDQLAADLQPKDE